MSITLLTILAITLLVVVFATARGDRPEQWCAIIIAGETLVDLAFRQTVGQRTFSSFELSRFLIDLVVLVSLFLVAMRANRIYPLAITAAQIFAVIGSLAVLLSADGMAQALWAMTQVPIFLQLILLAGGTLAHQHRVVRIGPYNCWSPRPGEAPKPAQA